jgi:inhibitor of KinA
MYRTPRIKLLTDAALVVEFGNDMSPRTNLRCHAFAKVVEELKIEGVTDVVPAIRSVTVHVDPLRADLEELANTLGALAAQTPAGSSGLGSLHEIPVRYGGEWGPDLEEVAALTGLEPHEVVRIHSGMVHRVYMLGFAPGFPYLGLLPRNFSLPRLPVPRQRVPQGSVSVAMRQTVIFPAALPSGWRIIGRAEADLFDPQREPPVLLHPGDLVRFVPTS